MKKLLEIITEEQNKIDKDFYRTMFKNTFKRFPADDEEYNNWKHALDKATEYSDDWREAGELAKEYMEDGGQVKESKKKVNEEKMSSKELASTLFNLLEDILGEFGNKEQITLSKDRLEEMHEITDELRDSLGVEESKVNVARG